MPDHWHLIEHKLVNGQHSTVKLIVRDGYEDIERKLGFEMGYDVSIGSCNDKDHLGPEAPSRGLIQK